MMAQFLQPVEQVASIPKIVLVAPETLWEALRLFQPVHALTFSQKNIRRLLARGSRDASGICRRYREETSPERMTLTA